MRRRVLIVDDDLRVRDAVSGLLKASDDLECAGAVETADAALGAAEADVVLVDLMLPKEDVGLELLAELHRTGRATVAFSARSDLAGAAKEAGADRFVEKAAGPEALLEALRGVGR